jgi:two-component system sensor histidine kinase UhpB
MSLRFWQSWSIGTRMACIAMLPVVLLFASFMSYSWYAHRIQVAEELAERGRILARALAETSEYNVISGNLSDLRLTIQGLVRPRHRQRGVRHGIEAAAAALRCADPQAGHLDQPVFR